MNKVVPDPPCDPAKDRAAFNRAIDHYLPTQGFHSVNADLSFEDALLYTASLLNSASATALDCGERLPPPNKQKSWPYGTCWKSPKPPSTAPSNA